MNPQEQSHPPDEMVKRFTITASTDNRGKSWYVTVPEWNYRNETNEAIDIHVGRIVNEIKQHNEASA